MEKLIVPLKNPEQGMPPHPHIPDRPVMWVDPGDRWLFRLTTNTLVPKSSEKPFDENETMVRYSVTAIKRGLENGGGIDYCLWAELEEIQPEKLTSVVVPVLCSGPSRSEHKDILKKEIEAIMITFQEIYKDPQWIIQFDYDEDYSNV